jgi:hypothetical protein
LEGGGKRVKIDGGVDGCEDWDGFFDDGEEELLLC